MTHDVTVGKYKPFKCHSLHWKRSLDNYADEGKFVVPAVCRLKGSTADYDNKVVATGLQFLEGTAVQFAAGYDNTNTVRFMGFIKRINFKVPVEVECEGYSYLLRKKRIPNRTYTNTKLKAILADIVKDTAITLSSLIPDITVTSVQFKDCNGLDCLDWFKDKMLMTVYFNYSELYVGLRYLGSYGKQIKNQLNWNVIKDDELLFETNKEGATVNMKLVTRLPTGETKTPSPGPTKNGTEKKVKCYGIAPSDPIFGKIQEDLQKKQNIAGYTGRITAFLTPVAELNTVDVIIDNEYNERNGSYVIEGVEGSFSTSGGRQKISIGVKLK